MSAVPSMQRRDPVASELRAEGAAAERARIVAWLRDPVRWKAHHACMADAWTLADAIEYGEADERGHADG